MGTTKGETALFERKAKILVADDNPMSLKVTALMLEAQGVEVESVASGVEALHRLQTETYDAALLDIEMPELDGLAIASRFRTDEPPGRRLPLIAITGNATNQDRELATAAGFDDFLDKPLDMARLAAVLDRLRAGL